MMNSGIGPAISVGVDIGGTFTDFVLLHHDSGRVSTFKLLTTPHDPSEAVLDGLEQILDISETGRGVSLQIIHGSTVATNALLERKGAPTALITTEGFRDILQIGRQDRPELYDFNVDPSPPLVPVEFRFEVNERISAEGEILIPLDITKLDTILSQIKAGGIESIAVCLLFSFLHPQHEREISQRLRQKGFFVSPSCEILPEYREYERMSTTVINAYVSPVLDRYLSNLESSLSTRSGVQSKLRVMQSNGGYISVSEARKSGVRCIFSGPAGGIVGAHYLAGLIGDSKEDGSPTNLITFDMGGTSTDVSLISGEPHVTTESQIGGFPIRIPVLDIHTIGAGGGSIASVDAGGALRVGPNSAGAEPGPACYAHGQIFDPSIHHPTVTDANLVLGRLAADHFLGGRIMLNREHAHKSLNAISTMLNIDNSQAALGVIEVANALMERALRVISIERGFDPKDYTMVSFGGAGGLHAAELARRLGIPNIIIPPLASTLSAFGMLAADVVKDYVQTVMLSGYETDETLTEVMTPLLDKGVKEIKMEGIPETNIILEEFLEMRYLGQSYELMVPFCEDYVSTFHNIHERTYGYSRINAPVEIVNIRVRAVGKVQPPSLLTHPSAGPNVEHALIGRRMVSFSEKLLESPFYQGENLQPGNRIMGPAVIVRTDTTILLGISDQAVCDPFLNIHIEVGD